MVVGAVQSQNVNLYGLNPVKSQKVNASNISFGLNEDCFIHSPGKVSISRSNFTDYISENEQEQIKSSVLEIANGENLNSIGAGADGIVYKIDTTGLDKPLVVKISHTENKNPITGEMQRTKVGYETEIDMLKSLSNFDDNSQQYIGHIKLNDGRTALITTLVDGKAPGFNLKEQKLNKESLSSILNILYELDEKNVLHRDLKKENIKINENDVAGIYDFGAAIKFDIKDFEKNTTENHFPIFETPTNLRNFEDTLLSPYLYDLSKTNPNEAKELFRDYLKLKSDFHNKKAENIKEIINNENLSKTEEKKLKQIADYEETLASVFKNPDNDIIQTELLKNNITYNAELAYKNEILLLNPMANVSLKMNAIISAKKLEEQAEAKINRPNTQEKKKYYEYKLQEAKFRERKIGGWSNGLVKWIIYCLTPNHKQNDPNVKNIISQCCNTEKNVWNFEIPNLQDNLK